MESWYAFEVDGTATLKKVVSKIQITYENISIKYGSPYDMGVYSKQDTVANKTIFYFTPAAKPLAEKFGAVECEAPAKDGLKLTVGPQSCLNFYPLEG
jgi:hypothetical protein